VVSALCQLIGTLAKHELGKGGWQELPQFLMVKVKSGEAADRKLGLNILAVLAESAGEQMKANLKDWLGVLRKTIEDTEEEVCYLSIVSLTHFVCHTGSDEANIFQQLIPTVLKKIELLARANQERATTALDIFDVLIECEVPIVVPHIKPMVELCIALAAEPALDDALRIKAVTFLGRLTRLKKKTIVKHKLYIPMINVIFSIMTQNEEEDDDDDAEEEDSPSLAAAQSLDVLALNLPPEKYISALLSQVQPALAHANPFYQRAAYQALAVSAEGCQDHIRNKYLSAFLQILGNGIRHEHQAVRNAALYMLGQFSENIQPEISNYAGDILPVLFQYLDSAFASLQPGVKESSSVSRIFYALDTFCENLEDKLVPHLPALMERALASLSDNFSIRIRELGINLMGSAANAVGADIIPYFNSMLAPLQTYLTMQHTCETQHLLTCSMSTLSVLARCVGEENFSREFAEKTINIGMQLVESNDDPDVRKCAYNLFGAVATIVKEDMASVMEACVTLMLKSLQSTEGVHLEMVDEESNLPLEQLEDDEEEEVDLTDGEVEAEDELEGVKSIGVENAYVSEKEQALLSLKDLSIQCGAAFYPFIYQSMEESWLMLDYPDGEVRCAAVLATAAFLTAYNKSGQADGVEAFVKGTTSFIPKLCEMVETEGEHPLVTTSLDGIAEMLKHNKQAVTGIPGVPEMIVKSVTKIMKNECACQDQEEEGGMEEDEEAEQDAMLFEYAGEVLPNLGRAMTPDTFAPFMLGLMPMLLKKTRKHGSVPERAFAVGALADCVEPLQGGLEPFLKHVLPVFSENLRDDEDDLRNNAVYGLGELVRWGGELMAPHYNQVLSNLSNLLGIEQAPRVIDQVVGAVARFIVIGSADVPVNEIVPVFLNNLPLREDKDEYEMVFKAFTLLYTAGHESIKGNIGKIIECAAACHSAKELDRDTILPIVNELLKQVARDFTADFQTFVSALPPNIAAKVMAGTA